MTESALLRKEISVSDEREKKEVGNDISSKFVNILRNVWVQKMKQVEVDRGAVVLKMLSSLPPVARETKIPCHFLKISAKLRFLAKKKVSVVAGCLAYQ